jgi:hypothetical protein
MQGSRDGTFERRTLHNLFEAVGEGIGEGIGE